MEQDKTRDERIAELLDKSALDAVGAIKGPSLSDIAPITEEKNEDDVQDVEVEETHTGGKKVRIPASRLKTLTEERDQMRSQLSEAMGRITALESSHSTQAQDDIPDWWKNEYGDTPESKQGYKNLSRTLREEVQREMREREEERLAVEEQRTEQVQAIEESFDEQMDSLEEELGRELTDAQKAEIMEVVGEYSPMEGDSYVAYIPISKAYDIWEKTQKISPQKQEMARIASATSTNTATQTPSSTPPKWGDWRKRF